MGDIAIPTQVHDDLMDNENAATNNFKGDFHKTNMQCCHHVSDIVFQSNVIGHAAVCCS